MHKDLPVINRADLLKNLQSLLPHIEKDILAYSESNAELSEHLQSQYRAAVEAERTAEHFVSWREAQITQAAVAWVLTCVFVRFLEDNGLLTEPVLAGPVQDAQGRNALQQAKERMVAYFNENPTFEERHYLLDLFAELEKYPVIAELLDHRHNPLWQIPVSADGAKRLIDFFQKIDADSGKILHDFSDPQWDTRFLGDLYQDLSESVRKRYALLQTPEFVENFILDYTLEPAIQTFGLPGLRLIDPTCGSGHFLLTTFERVFNQWLKREPGTNTRELAQRALNVVHGTDINPYAIAICRFRLLIAAMKAAGSIRIKDAPSFHFNLACGDSLLHGRRFEWQGQGNQQDLLDEKSHVYEVEDADKLSTLLGQRYHVVVGNPPYITVKDKALNQIYRNKYPTCHRQYSLGVPFTERFFDLTLLPEGNQSAGFMGMITANSFMKREFGKKLIEDYLPRKDLTHVVDTSGAFIPGHSTPTIILFARNQVPKSDQIQVVLGIRGEPGVPEVAAQGKVWSSIVQLLPKQNAESDYVTVTLQDRSSYAQHPWSIGGGGASELKDQLESFAKSNLKKFIKEIGRSTHTGEDSVFFLPKNSVKALGFDGDTVPLCIGENIRNWAVESDTYTLMPYDKETAEVLDPLPESQARHYWRYRVVLKNRRDFGQLIEDRGLLWYEHSMFFPKRFLSPLSITFAFVATHNHFVLDRGGKVFKQTAPVIKLSASATEAEHFALLGLLNSSTACFWGRQTFFGRGGFSDGKWQERVEWDGTKLKSFPVAGDSVGKAMRLAQKLDELALELKLHQPSNVLEQVEADVHQALKDAEIMDVELQGRMIALQEELDWYVYGLYGLIDVDLCCLGQLPVIELGQRAFEILLARELEQGESDTIWFEHHGSQPITEVPRHWPDDYQELVQKRLDEIERNPWIKLIDNKDHKRRWTRDTWVVRVKAAAREWLLDQIDAMVQQPQLFTCAQLADKLRTNLKVQQVAKIYAGSNMLDLQLLVSDLVAGEQVPIMAAARLKPEAMSKWFAWQETWSKQRQEDAIYVKYAVDKPLSETDALNPDKQAAYVLAKQSAEIEKQQVVGTIALPPAYKQPDFRQANYWPLRGKLDVPKERFFSLPGCEKGGDSTLVIGWAGLNHLQRAQAIAAWYLDRKEGEGWEAERLMPMLVALDELIPWLKQWHNEVDPEFGERMGDYYEAFLLEELRNLEITRVDLLSWQPAAVAGKRGGRKKKVAEQN
ncbi:BREX-2 system adenine-specific DNA-methyltransferase PglX [Pseudomonas aeruginosa]|uniref:BREX-2 system adenine-specific DNA-methyltransferase PglX n=1 Tax=Pseudomonas aeruginosa TaxID=287 RepID=UPI000A9AC61B|nr:BREX-2 system adenine-specific DNA-methyltransferase PglX [Pseudomonas aeruginosa]EKJ8516641.1 BREX-2 system adenine-specific DNA-methyltransferase PglX [Pseudomonas aeruginosa]ELK4803737.1 BREX-2 system adenine-specific DNA-methyltransferase PglX [Pseudomonas aeruginosa]ELK7305863.1 BREX-2 system adenine-specific DNA-methyltransferase PglX [Pseudomonas aeruginosa]ELP0274810.1 BREX-2 system adenine-specific DNA-methyltransferase PglX [Pseudomonas aeruginosa]MBA5041467.1 BREX-2 system adenin